MATVLLVEDELLIAHYLKEVLEAEEFHVVGLARDEEEAVTIFQAEQPDVVLMDVRLREGGDGIEAAQRLRQCDEGAFILIYLTAYGERETLQRARHTCPSGYLVKPVTDRTVVATITTALVNRCSEDNERGPERRGGRRVNGGGIDLDCSTGQMRSDSGGTVQLTRREVKLLALLLECRGKTVPYDELFDVIWPGGVVSENALKNLVWRLRRKLPCSDMIRAIPGFGYRID
ncbi:hypothetical protein CKO15_08110 [Halorhodospira abdelmalekii]|uniref:response regulator n=1 Tax=Halorhodospira abdelmalekii TaxID=421629 RepID=UPI001903F550|nr:response regulator [Halorhodospira abdelmalekii]MBK1735249.1 hypothetical protein [Halorhodospira abdelmalekii]